MLSHGRILLGNPYWKSASHFGIALREILSEGLIK